MPSLLNETPLAERIEFPAKAENIALAERLIDEACSRHGVHESHYGNILVALTEAVNNAIQHGNGLDPAKSVSLGYAVKGGRIFFEVRDQGAGFDFTNLPDPTDPQNIEKPHGRGVFLMRALADAVEFSDNGATVAMAFALQPATEPA